MKILIVSASDEAFMPLFRRLVESLFALDKPPFSAFACFDLGLSTASRAWVDRYAVKVVVPGWDLDVASGVAQNQPHLRALTVRPFLRDHFPGYDIYLWIDADAWVQESYALDWLIQAARLNSMGIVPEIDRAYRQSAQFVKWRMQRMASYFGKSAEQSAIWMPQFNAGVFSLGANSPHWTAWASAFRDGLRSSSGALVCDQTALNHVLWTQQLTLTALPATCNWLFHLAQPVYVAASGKFFEPIPLQRAIGIVHWAGESKPDMQLANRTRMA